MKAKNDLVSCLVIPDYANNNKKYKNKTYLVEIEHQIQFTHIVEVFIQHLNKIVNGFKVTQVIIINVHTNAKIETSVSSVYDFEITELK